MTALVIETAPETRPRPPRTGCVITTDASYAARLAYDGTSWFPQRWTLDGPEPYAVPLPVNQPEEPGTDVLPLTDGRVLIRRGADGSRHLFSLLYPTGPGTGEVPLGAVECAEDAELTLLPPAPDGCSAYALEVGEKSTQVWLVAGGAFGPEHVAEVPGRCSGGVWLDRTGRLLALDREPVDGGPVKTVAVDLERGGEVSPLLQIAEDSDDRLLLADLDSGLILVRSDAATPGELRLGWGVLGSTLPIRFPQGLRVADCEVTPFAVQPGQTLMPESCAVALRVESTAGAAEGLPWLGVWRPVEGTLHQLAAPGGWLAGAGFWSREGVLSLPYVTEEVSCGLARVPAPEPPEPAPEQPPAPEAPVAPRPVPLGKAPLGGRKADG
ncbi:hypothetical protein GTY65_10790 [Streptomyces sp. SID8379]|uniref:hypothetical protein n=1 Tax=unclassified Streptomyces TaxID=2593676 RepID=UPI0003786241|nr:MULTISPECIES: hypothetical protein [unclassified Streptomyces]MYW64551.1 hypothetical protein [Streptomyces sp. SID8379]